MNTLAREDRGDSYIPFTFNENIDDEVRRSKNPFLLAAMGMDQDGGGAPFGELTPLYPDA